jgi:hypothetical protein
MTEVRITDQEAADCFERLWNDAFERSGFDAVCTLLRVSGLQDAGWDPLEESEEAFKDFEQYLKIQSGDLSDKAQWRIGLLMYCQAVEMSAVHSMLANLLRILVDQPYHMAPLDSLGRPDKKRQYKWYPPSAKVKWRKIKGMAEHATRFEVIRLIDTFYNDAIRNAFSHSDYIITTTEFRWTEDGVVGHMPLEQVGNLIANSFSFFGVFLAVRDRWLKIAASQPRYHKWPNYEVLELLQDQNRKLNGFRIHFSNSYSARFLRTAQGVDFSNFTFQNDGTFGLMLGPLDKLQPVWMVDGRPVDFGDRSAVNEF